VSRAGALPEIWTYGHRSPQGLTIHPETGEIWMTEHDPQGGDELNLVMAGRNYGWPVIGYGKDYGGARLHTSVYNDTMEQPIQFWTPVIAPSGVMVYTGDRFPKWRGSIFVGDLTAQQLVRLPLTGADGHQIGMMDRPHLMMGYGRIRDVRQGPDGYLYLAMDGRYDTGLQKIVSVEPVSN
jgi:aldose sugar dehydrogenase